MKKMLLVLSFVVLASSIIGCSKTKAEVVSPTQTAVVEAPIEAVIPVQEEVSTVATEVSVTGDFAFMGLASFKENVDNGVIYVNPYNVNVQDSPDDIAQSLINAKGVDIATIPLDLAVELYNGERDDIRVLAIINTGGVYLVENGSSIKSVTDLNNKTIYTLPNTYQTQLEYILAQNDVEVTIEEVQSYDSVLEQEGAIVLMGEPYVTGAVDNYGANVCLDLESEWDKIQQENDVPAPFITSVLVSNTSFMGERANIIREFLMYANMSVNALNLGVEDGKNILESYDISEESIANTNVTYIAQEDMMFFVGAYCFAMNDWDDEYPIPDDNFYYIG